MRALRSRVFLSASVPIPERHQKYFSTADIFAIRDALKALVFVIIERNAELVFGGHPAITPMIRLQLRQSGLNVGSNFTLYQSKFFEKVYPTDNQAFERVIEIERVNLDQRASLQVMRREMLKGSFLCGIFIGGMEGVEDEFQMFKEMHRGVPVWPIASTGAAAKLVFDSDIEIKQRFPQLEKDLQYLSLMRWIWRESELHM